MVKASIQIIQRQLLGGTFNVFSGTSEEDVAKEAIIKGSGCHGSRGV